MNLDAVRRLFAHAVRPRRSLLLAHPAAVLTWLLNAFATIQLVLFYTEHVPPEINVLRYEQGLERNPFQHRLLLMGPMRWAHSSPTLNHWAATANSLPQWFPGGFKPEALLQVAIDVCCIATAGLVARSIYKASSSSGLLTPLVYPLTLLMVAFTYVFPLLRSLRFIYDLPALGFFAAGLYLIYFRCRPIWFAALFVVATINRETTLLLLPIYTLTHFLHTTAAPYSLEKAMRESHARTREAVQWKNIFHHETFFVLPLLSAYWIAWHVWVVKEFAGNPSAAGPRLLLNLGLLACPISWPQVASLCAYLLPFIFLYRRHIHDPVLRAWLWIFPLWAGFMLWYGLLLEIRIFGELIPLVSCCIALIAEELLTTRVLVLHSTLPAEECQDVSLA